MQILDGMPLDCWEGSESDLPKAKNTLGESQYGLGTCLSPASMKNNSRPASCKDYKSTLAAILIWQSCAYTTTANLPQTI